MSQDERVDTIDLIINVLKEHEKNLDTQIAKLDNIINAGEMFSPSQGKAKYRAKVTINKWPEFCEKSMKPQILTFNILDDKLEVSALKDDVVYVYLENIPKLSMEVAKGEGGVVIRDGNLGDLINTFSLVAGELKCGLAVKHKKVNLKLPSGDVVQKIIFEVDDEVAKSWISKELGIEGMSIIFGSIET